MPWADYTCLQSLQLCRLQLRDIDLLGGHEYCGDRECLCLSDQPARGVAVGTAVQNLTFHLLGQHMHALLSLRTQGIISALGLSCSQIAHKHNNLGWKACEQHGETNAIDPV